jgi:hypothetical protein
MVTEKALEAPYDIDTKELSEHQVSQDLTLSKEEEKRILRKIDWAIIPYCSLLYLLSFLVNPSPHPIDSKTPL